MCLTDKDIHQFINEGFVRVDDAFSKETATEVIDILWKDIPFDRNDHRTWSEPVVRLGMYSHQPFIDSVNTARLHSAFDQLIGTSRWIPCRSVGTFPVRFPSDKQPNDTGKHVDVSFPGDNPANYLEWRSNVRSKGRALLMLILYSDITDADAPTFIYKRSHLDIAKLLEPEGERGLSFVEIANKLGDTPEREAAFATGSAGTVYLCHPFLVHAAQPHHGKAPRFMAQPPLLLKEPLTIDGPATDSTPVEKAIQLALKS